MRESGCVSEVLYLMFVCLIVVYLMVCMVVCLRVCIVQCAVVTCSRCAAYEMRLINNRSIQHQL